MPPRAEGAGGGTVLHAKGTGMEGARRFLGVDLVNEKEMVFIVARSSEKNQIMKAIMTGADPKAGAIVFSLPVTDTGRPAAAGRGRDRSRVSHSPAP